MSKKNITAIVTFCLAMVFMVTSLEAQLTQREDIQVNNKRIGTAAASELLIPVGARDMAMSGAGLATTSGIGALFWNPGGVPRLEGSAEGMFSTMTYIADITVNYGAVGIKFGTFGTVAFSIKTLGFGDIPLTTVDDPEGVAGRTFSPNFTTVGLTYGRQFTDAITVGATFKLISEQMHRVTGSGFAMDVGIQYHGVAGITGVNLGVCLKNVGPQLKFDGPGLLRRATASVGRRPDQYYASLAQSWELPTSIEIGLAYEYVMSEELNFNLNTAYINNSLALDNYRVGAEANFMVGDLAISGRGGMDLWDAAEDDEAIFGPTFGGGITYKAPNIGITIDYAYRSVDLFSNNSMFSVILSF